ncbi:MAG: SRPBCC family protein [Angustibacter sp.]
MDLQHTFTVPIGIDEAWSAFTDIERIAPCLPGATITSVEGEEFHGTAKVKLGPIALQYAGKGVWVSRDDTTYQAVIEAQGKDKRGNGTAGATIRAHLEPEGEGTRVVVDTELKITGRPAQFGRGVIQDVGTKLLDQFAACLVTRLGEQGPVEAEAVSSPEAAAEAGPTTQAEPTTAELTAAAAASEPPVQAAPVPVPAAPVPPRPVAPAAVAPSAEINLGGVVGPVLLKRYGPWVAALVVVGVVVWLIARR